MTAIVHMVGETNGAELSTGYVREVRTRCGRIISRPVVGGAPARYTLVAENGNVFQCTTRTRSVSCVKCLNLLTVGTIYARRTPEVRPAKPQKRAVARSAGQAVRGTR